MLILFFISNITFYSVYWWQHDKTVEQSFLKLKSEYQIVFFMMNTLKCWYFVTRSRVSIGHRSLFLVPNWLINSHFLKQANENKLKRSSISVRQHPLTFHSQKTNKIINENISYLNPQLRTTNPPMSRDEHGALKVRKHTSCGTETCMLRC